MKLSPYEATSSSADQIIPRLLYNAKIYNRAGSEVLTAVVMKRSILWDIKACIHLKVNRRFGHVASILLGLFFDPEDGDTKVKNKVKLSL
jgi:hypothetical protein